MSCENHKSAVIMRTCLCVIAFFTLFMIVSGGGFQVGIRRSRADCYMMRTHNTNALVLERASHPASKFLEHQRECGCDDEKTVYNSVDRVTSITVQYNTIGGQKKMEIFADPICSTAIPGEFIELEYVECISKIDEVVGHRFVSAKVLVSNIPTPAAPPEGQIKLD